MSRFATIYVGCKQLGIDEEDRRDLFERLTKKRSLKQMTLVEIKQVEQELSRLGFKKTSKQPRKGFEGKFAKKLQALWIAAWNLGIVNNKSDQAMVAFVKRQCKVDHVRFLRHKEDADKAIEALKAWMAREAGVDWTVGEHLPDWLRLSGAKIAVAQHDLLFRLQNKEGSAQQFASYVLRTTGRLDIVEFKDSDWIPVMNALGTQIRAAK
jgi:phage gp16-like protein